MTTAINNVKKVPVRSTLRCLELYNFAMELHEKLNISERHIRRAIIDAFGIECPERTIRGWLNGRYPLGNCKGFKNVQRLPI